MSTPTRIVYGKAAASNIADVLGYAAADDDLVIKEIASERTTDVEGNTAKVEVYNPGKEASGTLILTSAHLGNPDDKIGMIVQIAYRNRPNQYRPYRVTQWDASTDADTGIAVCQFAGISEDSMVEEYNLGPRDPETGELIGTKRKLCVNFVNAGTDAATVEGVVFGLFSQSVAGSGGDTGKISRAKANSGNAVALATCRDFRLDFFAVPGDYYLSSVTDGMTSGYAYSTQSGFGSAATYEAAPEAQGGELFPIETVA